MHHDIHIGRKIQSVFNQSGLSVSQFARLLDIQRTRAYNIFNSKTLDIDLLCRISDVLHYDFISEYLKERVNNERYNDTFFPVGTRRALHPQVISPIPTYL